MTIPFQMSMFHRLSQVSTLTQATHCVSSNVSQHQFQQLRFKKVGKWIVPHKKPRWVPMARSKMFKFPPESKIPVQEQVLIKELEQQYLMRMRALQHYLYEEDVKAGDTGEAALIAAEKEEKIHIQNLADNDEENKRIAEARALRLLNEAEERKSRIQNELIAHEEQEKILLEKVEVKVEKEIVEMENRIKPEDLERAIETALANPVDFEYAIDLQGNIFRGRTTKSKKVNPAYYEQLELAGEN